MAKGGAYTYDTYIPHVHMYDGGDWLAKGKLKHYYDFY